MKKYLISFLIGLSLFMITGVNSSAQTDEMSAAWVSTVYNLDWPSSNSKNNPQMQKQELINMLDNLKETGINTIVLQVRPKADALYKSSINPWSDVLTGTAGKDPGYDPLKFAVEEAHKRNMEIHAWFNPYRVTTSGTDFNKLAANSPARLHPEWVISYNNKLYYDPGLPEVRKHIVDTVNEVVSNYNVDGIHFDDYFYPDSNFTDNQTYNKYGNGMEKGDWRRSNVNNLLKDVKTSIKSIKPNVKFGVSPSGIWRNKSSDPTGSDTRGSESYSTQYADTRYWIKNNLIDYVTPQLYWPIGYSVADYSKLVSWWANEVSGSNVNLYIGQGIYKQGTGDWVGQDIAGQIIQQVNLNRQYSNIKGSMYFSAKDIMSNKKLQEDLKTLYIKDSENKEIKTLAGETRFETATAISKEGWKDGADKVILVNGYSMIDGIAATPLASLYDCPILLTNRNDVPKSTMDEIKRLNPSEVVLIGTDDVTGDNLINILKGNISNLSVNRIGGIDRYETALLIAKEIAKYKPIENIYVANGFKEADALSVASHAGEEVQPIILTDTYKMEDEVYNWIKSKGIKNAYFIGDEEVVGDNIIEKVNGITSNDVKGNRLGGIDRQETNAKVIEKFYNESSYNALFVSKSDPLVDALTAGPLAAKLKSPIVMVGNQVSNYQQRVLSEKSTNLIYKIADDINENSFKRVVELLN
ncbi:MAG: family 10 glycosylhydrolase [Paraclostridium bifermentans]|uniref:family 10 glycosylhydrolase n=1 Tax=Paraclostridium bifermentans TaxID=1490 RepID=UPI0011DD6DEC|nr:family 10 glycosylhydrolase [Paraclostridium bifermentans]MBS6507619.1 family 10 glycosylhydrolase [Paraclostridium bifermentans]MDU3802646.1 family 10 glycosylhydrolase [Paraclostridium bifermentans]